MSHAQVLKHSYRGPLESNTIAAIILGLVEGITEFLPISSTGHLILTSHYLGLEGEKIKIFEVFIQLGAILAVAILYWNRFLGLLDFKAPKDAKSFRGINGLSKLALACLPALVCGALFHSTIKGYLFYPRPVALALIVGGLALMVIERVVKKPSTETLDAISHKQALLVGVFQCFSLWPGISRSASTIVGGLVVGLPRSLAAEFSFLVAVPIMVAATGYDLLKGLEHLSPDDTKMFAIGFIVSFLSALLAVKIFIQLVGKYSLVSFGIYRILLGLLVFALL